MYLKSIRMSLHFVPADTYPYFGQILGNLLAEHPSDSLQKDPFLHLNSSYINFRNNTDIQTYAQILLMRPTIIFSERQQSLSFEDYIYG